MDQPIKRPKRKWSKHTAPITPAEERFDPQRTDRGRKLALTKSERETLYRIDLAKKALLLLVEQSKTFPQIAESLGLKVDELVEFSDTLEFAAFKKSMAEKVAAMYLDPEHEWSRRDMQEALGMTTKRFRNFIQSDIFKQVYEETLLKLTEDPGPRAVQAKIIEELLPEAYRTLRWELSAAAPPSVRQKARQDVFRLAGVSEVQTQASDRHEIAAFLNAQNVNLSLKVEVPQEYAEAVKKYLPDPVVDGEFSQPADHPGEEQESGSEP